MTEEAKYFLRQFKGDIFLDGAINLSYGEKLYGPKDKCKSCKKMMPKAGFKDGVCHSCLGIAS